MTVLVTGAHGFLGWHTRARLHATMGQPVVPVGRSDWSSLPQLADRSDAVIHIAGVNRGDADTVEWGNIQLAEDLVRAVSRTPVRRIVFANSIQAGTDSAYGRGKARAAEILADASRSMGLEFFDLHLPNLFGEGGRPNYNSFVATFVQHVLNGSVPDIADREIELLHVQEAAAALIDGLDATSKGVVPIGVPTSVRSLFNTLRSMYALYKNGDIPPLTSAFEVQLFNTLRYAMFPAHYPIPLPKHSDQRGALTEAVKVHGGQGQTFVSTTVPGVTRGEHVHLRKVERFVVVRGSARIELRKVLSSEVLTFEVNGEDPVVVDMPTLWAHNITNTGDTEVITLFWANELFDPEAPDTYAEPVRAAEAEGVLG